MRSGFVNILSKYNGTSIVDIKSMPMLLDYIEYLGAEDFKKEIEKNFKFIGQVSIRALRTRSKTCQMKGKRKGKACYEEQYTTDTKFFNPVLFKLPDGTQDYFYYYPREQLRILSEAKGLHSTYDGSGYIIAFDHTDSTYIEKHRLRFKALRPSFFQDNTKAVIVNYNLNYPVLNVNCSIEVVPGAHPALRDLSLRRSGRQSDRPAPIRARLSAEPLQPVHD